MEAGPGMSETEQPLRATPAAMHQCVCLLQYEVDRPDGRGGVMAAYTPSRCAAMVADPDSPFCAPCEEAGHPQLIRLGGVTKP